ncbi:MAG: alternative ribosome rescue aminoacyl-tRNA hydrolase ArfB [Bacteroidota bacterium]
MNYFDEIKIKSELKFRTSRSSGPGGQSVNKVNTKVELLFDVWKSAVLTSDQKDVISKKLSNRINVDGILSISSEETRSQFKNKELVVSRFIQLLNEALVPIKKRKATKRSKASVEKRLRNKKYQSDKKKNRRNEEE